MWYNVNGIEVYMKKVLIILSVLFITNSFVYAGIEGYDPGVLNQQYMREMRMHEFASRARNQQNAIINTTDKKQTENSNTTSNIPVNTIIKTITFVNNNFVSTDDLNRIVSYNLNKPATMENIAEIRSLLTRYYQANGYFSAIVTPNTNNIRNGQLIFEIQEGTKNSIIVE